MVKEQVKDTVSRILSSYPQDVLDLYQDYGIKARPSIQSVADAYTIYGEPFLYEFFDIGYTGDHFLGKLFGKRDAAVSGGGSRTEPGEEKKEKGKFWDRFKEGFGKAVATVRAVATGGETAKDVIDNTGSTPPPPPPPEPTKSNNTILFIGIGVVVVLVIVLLVTKRNK